MTRCILWLGLRQHGSMHEQPIRSLMRGLCKIGALLGLQIDWRPLLPRIRIPCLNLIGCKNGVFPPDGTRVVSQLVPNCIKVRLHYLSKFFPG